MAGNEGIDDTGCKYVGILEYDKVKERKIEDEFAAGYKQRINLLLKLKFDGKHKSLATNAWAAVVLTYSFRVLDWKNEELTAMDEMTRKVMIMLGAPHSESDVDSLVCGCKVLAQKEYERRHDNIDRIVHWLLCGSCDLRRVDKCYEHYPEGTLESESVKIYGI